MYEQMGLGWTLGHFKGEKTVCHGGAGFGSTSFLLILPEKNCAAVLFCNEESNACNSAVQAVADALIGQKPCPSSVSWMVPISHAMASGGILTAYTCYDEIKASGTDQYSFAASDLIDLSLQLMTARQLDLAIEVLGLNIYVYPEYAESYIRRAHLYTQKGDIAQAEEDLLSANSICH
jgi:hypothetical protein